MSKAEIFFKLSEHALEWAKVLIPALIAWHFPPPNYRKFFKKDDDGPK